MADSSICGATDAAPAVASRLDLFGPKKLPELGKGLGEAIRGSGIRSRQVRREQPKN
jgi:hypothetical protein